MNNKFIVLPENLNENIWLPIPPGINKIKPYYIIDKFGLIYSNYSENFIIPHYNHAGYLEVTLCGEYRRISSLKIHRLVMMTYCYIDGCEKLEVNHKDGNKTNNHISNLEWCTSKQNKEHAILNGLSDGFIGESNPKSKIKENDVINIYNLLMKGLSDDEIVDIVGCNKSIIAQIALGKTWRYMFNQDQLNAMIRTRNFHTLTNQEKHLICKYFQDNIDFTKKSTYGYAKYIVESSLNNINLPVTDRNIRAGKRLYYRFSDRDINSLYNY